MNRLDMHRMCNDRNLIRRQLIVSMKITYVIERLQGLAMEINALYNSGCVVLHSSAEFLKNTFFPLDDMCNKVFIKSESRIIFKINKFI